ncbi:MAG: YbbR-like domain-containing protein [Clostridia bacterium]
MTKKLDKILKSKSFYVVVSILLGIVSWLLVLNYTNPKETRSLEIPLTILNKNGPSSYGLSDQTYSYPENITVKASGRTDIIGNLTASDFYAAVDFSKITSAGTTTLEVSKPECSHLGIKIEDYYPKTIDFKFDQMTQRNVDVVVEYDDSLLREGYEFLSVTAEPSSVQISGFASEIDEIECIRVRLADSLAEDSIDSNRTGSFIGRFILTNGEDVTAKYDTEKITVKIEVAKRVPVLYDVTGTPHDDYYLNTEKVSPETVLLRGPAAELRNITSIHLGNIDITGASENVVRTFRVSEYLPDEIAPYKTSEIQVTAEILKYEVKSFSVDVNSSISTPGKDPTAYIYEFRPERFSIRVKGKAADLNALSVASLGPTLDLTGRGVGEYRIPLYFTNIDTDKFTIIGEYVYTVTISPITSNVTPTPSPTPNTLPPTTSTPTPTEEITPEPTVSTEPAPTPEP